MKNMKKIIVLLFFVFAVQNVFAADITKYVAVNNCVIRQKDSATSKVVAKIECGASVKIIKEKGSWSYVQQTDKTSVEGWIPTSALSKKKIVASKKVNANAKELALAGKGLWSSLEEDMCKEYNYDYSLVDAVELVKVTDAEVIAFMKEGKLKAGAQ